MTDRLWSGSPTIRPLAESALLVKMGDAIDPGVVARAAALAKAIEAAALPGVVDIVPAYTTVLVAFDPVDAEPSALTTAIRRLAADASEAETVLGQTVTIPVAYGGMFGPDLDDVAAKLGLPPSEVIARHAAAEYLVACIGFAPGFPYLMGMPAELATPRLPDPRIRVPSGSVAIGGHQTGIYTMETPGGWRIIGRTPVRLFDLGQAKPFLLQAGDRVRFRRITEDAFAAIAQERGVEGHVVTTEGASDA